MDVNHVETFSSIQGEGPDVGRRTLFVRLGGCDLRCAWCDTPHTWLPVRQGRVEQTAGHGDFVETAGDTTVAAVLASARPLLDATPHRFVSLTGGEPLLQPAAVRALATGFRALGPEVHLETHGLLADALAEVISEVDVVSMDWKLATDVRRETDAKTATPAPFHDAHERFLAVAKRAPRTTVKIVITERTADEELDEAARRIARVHGEADVILQPVTPFAKIKARPSPERMLALEARLVRVLPQVRVIPQTHPVWGVR